MTEMKRRCSYCERMRPWDDIHSISRHGGGSYNRAGRNYSTSICSECVLELLPYAIRDDAGKHWLTSRYSTSTLLWIARELWTPARS